jgi:hypothetical protein
MLTEDRSGRQQRWKCYPDPEFLLHGVPFLPASTAPRARLTTVFEWCLLALVLLTTTAWTLAISLHRVFDWDELLAYWTDRVPTANELLHIQLHSPISLDPPVFHLLSHWSMTLFGPGEIAFRLPAHLSFLVMQVCLFTLGRRLGGARAGIVAALIPFVTTNSSFAVQGRPYSFVLACYAAALLAWYLAKCASTEGRRGVAKVVLGAALVLCVLSHFYGLLILLPIAAAEVSDSFERRRIDVGVVLALCAGVAAVALLGPFRHALDAYRTHYYAAYVGPALVPLAYRFLFTSAWELDLSPGQWVFVMLCVVLLVAGTTIVLRRPGNVPRGMWVGVLVLGLLPFLGVALAVGVVHTIEARHVLPALLAVALLAGVCLAPLWDKRAVLLLVVVACLVFGSRLELQRFEESRLQRQHYRESLQPDPAGAAFLAARPGAHVYVMPVGVLLTNGYYLRDSTLRSQLRAVYDPVREERWELSTTYSVTAEALPKFTPFAALSMDKALADPDAVFLLSSVPTDWLRREFEATHYTMTPVGHAFGGTLVTVQAP